jgi:hypothetical protein
VRDRPDKCIYNALIAVYPNNNIMLNCINKIVSNVKQKFYGNCALHPTGPRLFGNYFTNKQRLDLPLYFSRDNNNNLKSDRDYITYNNTIILINYEEYRKEQHETQETEYYSILWKKKNIYK